MQQSLHKLNDGHEIPVIGFGTWQLQQGSEAKESVLTALEAGYRLIDTAAIYGNEVSVGKAISECGIDRNEIFLTTKLWTSEQGYGSALDAFAESLKRLDLEYVDLYLIHWPGPSADARLESWRALTEIQRSGKSTSIGVSNFELKHLHDFLDKFDNVPAVNQIQFNPFNYSEQKPILDFCKEHNILVEAYSPLGRGRVNDPLINKIAEALGKTNAQIMIRWAIQHDTVPIPKSATPERIRQNLNVFDFELSDEQMSQIDGLSQKE